MTCGYSTTSAGTGVGLFCTLGDRAGIVATGASLCTLGDASSVVMATVTVVVAVVVVVKTSVRFSKDSIRISLCGRYPQNTSSGSFSDYITASAGVTVV